jgi:hypothetical protein
MEGGVVASTCGSHERHSACNLDTTPLSHHPFWWLPRSVRAKPSGCMGQPQQMFEHRWQLHHSRRKEEEAWRQLAEANTRGAAAYVKDART